MGISKWIIHRWLLPAIPLLHGLLPAQEKPNLLFIVADQFRFDAIGRAQESSGIAARSRIRTPNLDRISKEGAWFRNAYTNCAVCAPARTSFLTGRALIHTGVANNTLAEDEALKIGDPDAARRLTLYRTYDQVLTGDHGYAAEFYGKWHSPQSLGWCYRNDLRAAGNPSLWYGKYNADQTKRYSAGLEPAYLDTLGSHSVGPTQIGPAQLLNTFTKRAYVPDPLDSRYQNANAIPFSQPDLRGMDLMPEPWSTTAVEGREAIDALDRLGRTGSPFSLSVSFHSPHAPMVPTAKYYRMYDPADMPVPASISDPMDNSAYKGANGMLTRSEYRDPAKVKRWTADYYGLASEVDEWVGAILGKLKAMGLDRKTLVVFVSDHGEMLGAHGLREKNIFYEESAHIPLLLWMPGRIAAGTIVDQPVTTLDLHASILDYLGINPIRYPTDGKSLRRFIEGKEAAPAYAVTFWDPGSTNVPVYMIREGNWKLMLPNRKDSRAPDMLFDLKTDPNEMKNLLGVSASTASEFVRGKAEGLKALMAENLRALGDSLVEEVENRRTWPGSRLWVSDTSLGFGHVGNAAVRRARLSIGSSLGGDVVITGIRLEGPLSGRFRLDWTQGTLAAGSNRALTIVYTDSGAAAKGEVRLILNHDSGASKVVKLRVDQGAPIGNHRLLTRLDPLPGMGFLHGHGMLRPNGMGAMAWRASVYTAQGRRVGTYAGIGSAGVHADLPPGLLILKWETSGGYSGNGVLLPGVSTLDRPR